MPVTGILELPGELIGHIAWFLLNKDMKNYRLASKMFAAYAILCFERVFISANRIDIDAITEVASRKKYAKQVKELIWVEAHFPVGPGVLMGYANDYDRPTSEASGSHGDVNRSPIDVDLHEQLLQEQRDIMVTNEHVETLRNVLACFTCLQKVTITDRVDDAGRVCYPTPMMRAFKHASIPKMWKWRRYLIGETAFPGPVWRGLVILVEGLAHSATAIKEFHFDSTDTNTGIPWEFFDRLQGKLGGLEQVFARGLERVNFCVDIAEEQHGSLSLSRLARGSLHRILYVADQLKYLELSTNCRFIADVSDQLEDARILQAIPMERFQQLVQCKLQRMLVCHEDLIKLFGDLPATIQNITFHDLFIRQLTWSDAMPELKSALPWTNGLLSICVYTTADNLPEDFPLNDPETIIYVVMDLRHHGHTTWPEHWHVQELLLES